MGIARFQKHAHLGAGLLNRRFDEFVDELGDQEAESEEHALKLAAKDEMGNEPAEAYEDGDE